MTSSIRARWRSPNTRCRYFVTNTSARAAGTRSACRGAGRSCRSATLRCSCAAPVRLPPGPDPGSTERVRAGVRVRPGGVQRRDRRPPGRPRGRGAVPDRRGPVQGADRGEADPGAGVARRGLGRGPATGPRGREHRLPELLRLGEGHAEGPTARRAAVPVEAGPGAVDPVHQGGPVPGHRRGPVAAARDRGRAGALVPGAAGRGVVGDGHGGRGRAVSRLVRRRRPRRPAPAGGARWGSTWA